MIICYDPGTGRITNVYGVAPPTMSAHLAERDIPHLTVDERELSPVDLIEGYYVADGGLTERPVFDVVDRIEIVADGVDTASVVLPDPCLIRVDGEEHTVEGGVLELRSDMPAEYALQLLQWPYIEKAITVIAHAAE